MSAVEIATPDLLSLVTGEAVVAFAERGAVDEGDEVELRPGGPRPPEELKPAYRHWADRRVEGEWTAVVEAVHPAALLDPDSGAARHVLAATPDGDLLVLRVYGSDGPVLSDTAFEARRRSVQGALPT